MESSSNVNINTVGGGESSVSVSPQTLTISSGSPVTFRDNNSGTTPNSIRVTFPANITCRVSGKVVSALNVPVNGAVNATLEGGQSEGNYGVASTWGEDVVTASPVIIIE